MSNIMHSYLVDISLYILFFCTRFTLKDDYFAARRLYLRHYRGSTRERHLAAKKIVHCQFSRTLPLILTPNVGHI